MVMEGYDFGQVGEKDGHAGVIHKFSRFAGAYPPNMWSKRGSVRPLVRRGPVSPNHVLKKKRCACSARAAGTLLARQN